MAGLKRPEDFDVWKLAWELKRRVFAFTATSPASSDRRFCDDIRRAARSGPDLVAEGYYGFNPREFPAAQYVPIGTLNVSLLVLSVVHFLCIFHARGQRFTERVFVDGPQDDARAPAAAPGAASGANAPGWSSMKDAC